MLLLEANKADQVGKKWKCMEFTGIRRKGDTSDGEHHTKTHEIHDEILW